MRNTFFFKCKRYSDKRTILFKTTMAFHPLKTKNLLFGDENLNYNDNCMLFASVELFIQQSGRFMSFLFYHSCTRGSLNILIEYCSIPPPFLLFAYNLISPPPTHTHTFFNVHYLNFPSFISFCSTELPFFVSLVCYIYLYVYV